MGIIVDLLKGIAALGIIAGACYYLLTQGLPPRGKGRWRAINKILKDKK